jgi:hypothetical protein
MHCARLACPSQDLLQERRAPRSIDKHSRHQSAPHRGSDGGSVPSVAGDSTLPVESHHGPHATLGTEAARSGCLALSPLPQPRFQRGDRSSDKVHQKLMYNKFANEAIEVACWYPGVKLIIDSVCHNKFSLRNVVGHMCLHHSARLDVACISGNGSPVSRRLKDAR